MQDKTRGYVRGLSMWPNLIPRDIFKTEEIPIQKLKPQMIALFPEPNNTFIVHRVLSIKHNKDKIIVNTGGDRSGPDKDNWSYQPNATLLIVTGVLRKGQYRTITKTKIPRLFSPNIIIRIYNKIIRTLFW